MKYAVFSLGGKQQKASVGDEFIVNKLKTSSDKVEIDDVLLLVDGEDVIVGEPTVPGARVIVKVLGGVKGDKIRVVKFKAKSRYRRTTGFRAKLTRVKLEEILQK